MPRRLAVGLAGITVSVLCLAGVVGVLPDTTGEILKGRKALCEAVAIHCSLAAQRNDLSSIQVATQALVDRNPEVLSAAVRRADGTLMVEVGNHRSLWKPARSGLSTPTHAFVPIALADRPWGTVEVRFAELAPGGPFPGFGNPEVRLIGFVTALGFCLQFAYLRAVFRRSGVSRNEGFPQRVRATLDTLVEGVLLLDKDQNIALANKAFARAVGRSSIDLEGRDARAFQWSQPQSETPASEFPWKRAIDNAEQQTGAILELQTAASGRRTMSINAMPILGEDGTLRGALATFDDLTHIERKNAQLKKLLDRLKHSRAEIRRQNDQLRDLATLDPLTGCLNRRAYFERFDLLWQRALEDGHPLSCVMLDIDHFKSINDRHGHSVGDLALKEVSGVLKTLARTSDVVCRYGGEEFCVTLPNVGIEEAARVAERFRQEIASRLFANITVTSSFGVAAIGQGANDPHALLNQADQALYAAKRTGRNRVVRSDQIPADLPPETPRGAAPAAATPPSGVANPPPVDPGIVEAEVPVPYPAVTALISALAYRDADTAAHSRRVADLCVAAAQGLMSARECYDLEIAALLHDIGKLGVPDAILRKPGPLTEQEWLIMGTHDRVGTEIVAAAFAPGPVGRIIGAHHAWYAGNPRHPGLPTGAAIPTGARLLAIADAYDAMTSDRVYRKAKDRGAAVEELRRHAGVQFDPELVERFVTAILAQDECTRTPVRVLSKRTAFKIGLQIERLADALDSRDGARLATMAARLQATAAEHGIPPIREAAAALERTVTSEGDWLETVTQTSDLLELCRSTQSAYLDAFESVPPTRP
jgi:diguanylate cyclase (GGDEF)-like protein/PAS domain S-box-containing protein